MSGSYCLFSLSAAQFLRGKLEGDRSISRSNRDQLQQHHHQHESHVHQHQEPRHTDTQRDHFQLEDQFSRDKTSHGGFDSGRDYRRVPVHTEDSYGQQQQHVSQQSDGLSKAVSQDRSGDDGALRRFEAQVEAIALQLEHPSLSQAKRFALKKDMAKARANVIRLTRQQAQQN